jgi:hypothetical protein
LIAFSKPIFKRKPSQNFAEEITSTYSDEISYAIVAKTPAPFKKMNKLEAKPPVLSVQDLLLNRASVLGDFK